MLHRSDATGAVGLLLGGEIGGVLIESKDAVVEEVSCSAEGSVK